MRETYARAAHLLDSSSLTNSTALTTNLLAYIAFVFSVSDVLNMVGSAQYGLQVQKNIEIEPLISSHLVLRACLVICGTPQCCLHRRNRPLTSSAQSQPHVMGPPTHEHCIQLSCVISRLSHPFKPYFTHQTLFCPLQVSVVCGQECILLWFAASYIIRRQFSNRNATKP